MKRLLFILFGFICISSCFAQSAWPDSIYTARNATYLTQEERMVIAELNKARTNPQRYAREVVEPFLKCFDAKYTHLYHDEDGQNIMTLEGQAAVYECIEVLKKAKPVPMLRPIEGLAKAAKWLAADQRNGETGHDGTDGSGSSGRMKRYGRWEGYCAENVNYGSNKAQSIVLQLLIDDGVESRGHRKNIMNPQLHLIGVGIDTHSRYGYSCVMDFAERYINK